MSAPVSRRGSLRGQPVLVFASILGGWTIMRVLLWTSPFPAQALILPSAFRSGPDVSVADRPVPIHPSVSTDTGRSGAGASVAVPWTPAEPVPAPLLSEPGFASPAPAWLASDAGTPPVPPAEAPMRRIGGHYMLLAAGLSNMALPPEIAAAYDHRAPTAGPAARLAVADRPLLGSPARSAPRESRWSADGWLLWREGSGSLAAPGAASYGRSQGGAVVRYRLAEGSHRPVAYARVTRTLEGARQGELAAGVSLRPVAALPVSVAVEGRVTETTVGREVRPAAFAVTELPPARLPLGLRGEAYAQAGYVGGRFATPFVDGQAKVDGRVARLGSEGEMRGGVGVWGGAQKGAARLDVGPSAALQFRLGETQSRVAVDYRLRVAGDAEPKSGPAVTFSAGF